MGDDERIPMTWESKPQLGIITTRDGHRVHNVHRPELCAGHVCCVHNPSNHHMVTWPTWWPYLDLPSREGKTVRRVPMMYRICPHGEVHKDPDSLAYLRGVWRGVIEFSDCTPACDGCCQP